MHIDLLQHTMGKWARKNLDGTWETPESGESMGEAGMQLTAT